MNRKEAERLAEKWLHQWIPDIACNPTDTDLMAIKSLTDSYLRTYKKGVKEGQNPSCSSKCRHNKIVTPITKGRKPNVQRAK